MSDPTAMFLQLYQDQAQKPLGRKELRVEPRLVPGA
jgi:hypothetical protein